MAPSPRMPNRRAVLAGLAGAVPALALAQPGGTIAPGADGVHVLTAAPLSRRLRPEPAKEAALLAFNGAVPGPVLRARQGEEIRVRFENRTGRPLALHWHGVRIANAMDGVAGLTQPPIRPGGDFEYRFTPPDAGTFLVRPMVPGGSAEAQERGLAALLVVEEREPPPVDAEHALIVDDWRLAEDGSLAPLGDPMEAATLGRLGNWLTVAGGAVPHRIEAAPGGRLRLRLANAANARSMRIRFDNLRTWVVAVDGQPSDTFEPLRATLPFGPGNRYDLVVEAGEAGERGAIVALLGGGVPLLEVAATRPTEASRKPLPALAPLAPNKALPPAIRLQDALRREFVIAGGAKPGPNGQPVIGDPKKLWTLNGALGQFEKPAFSVRRGAPVVLTIVNQTPVVQPFHLHGHSFRMLHPFDDGWEPYWLDTVQIPENRTVRLAFDADNPGKWLLASTVLERFDAGLWTWFEVG